MFTDAGHLTYCTNIHPGESWKDHFASIKKYFPVIKEKVSPEAQMGIGLRLSNEASVESIEKENLADFKHWLKEQNAYVFTMNGFPYGGFHNVIVKDKVHQPDWTTPERVDYTLRLFHLLSSLLPAEMDGGVSTSPLSYRHWFKSPEALADCRETATKNVIHIAEELIRIQNNTGKLLHLDIEPEPDGVMETGEEFLDWFENDLLRLGIPVIKEKFKVSGHHAEDLLKEHIRLCYDVCHFAIGYEPHTKMINEMLEHGIKIGKIQISAALKCNLEKADRKEIQQNFEKFNEPVYLHQVVARMTNESLLRYPDLPQAIHDIQNPAVKEWRAHYHVPIFTDSFGVLSSTNDDIVQVLSLQKEKPYTNHLEVETYTWDVLPSQLKLPLADSVARELDWLKQIIEK
ncbi:MAG: metabolite traffic protein EboE [Ginsengibacter sp.]